MRATLVAGLVLVACAVVTYAKPMPPLCRLIKKYGCSEVLKDSGKVCGTNGITYRNACLLRKKSCKLGTYIGIAFYAECESLQSRPLQSRPQQQNQNNNGGETVLGVGNGDYGDQEQGNNNDVNEAGDTPDDGEDTPDVQEQGNTNDVNEPGDTPDGGDTPSNTPNNPNGQNPGARPQGAPNPTEMPDVSDAPDVSNAPDVSDTPVDGDSSSSSSSSSEEGGAGGAGGAGGGAGAGAGGAAGGAGGEAGGAGGAGGAANTMRPITNNPTSLPPFSPGAKVCPNKCPKARTKDMVCASDGQTYESMCHLQQHLCQTNETIAVLHRGLCNNTCGPECPMVYEPVCGTDDLTYMSRCDLTRTACLTQDETLQLAYNQECAGAALLKGCLECAMDPNPVCSTNNMTFRSQCEFDRFVCIFDVRSIEIAVNESCPDAPLLCPNYCEPIDDPVCATDGVTYPNMCEVGVADCHAKTLDPMAEILFESFGVCVEGTQNPCSATSPDCELYEEPVCGMKGTEMISYYNMCFFEKETCFEPSLKFISDGKCVQTIPPVKIKLPVRAP